MSQIPPLMTPFLLGRRVELMFHDYSTRRCVVIGMMFTGERAVRVLPESRTRYEPKYDAYFPHEGANVEAQTFSRSDIRTITIIDRNEIKVPEEM